MSAKQKCTAKSKRTGKRCGQWPIPGAEVCKWHGGKAPQVQEAAKQRLAEQQAHREVQRMMARAGVDMDPTEHLVESLQLAAQLVNVWGTMAAELDEAAERENEEDTRGGLGYTEDTGERSPYELNVFSRDRLLALNRHGEAQVHPYMQKYEEALDRWGKFSKMAIDAGVAVRQVELTERQVEKTNAALEGMYDDLNLTDAQKQEARRAFANRLRAG